MKLFKCTNCAQPVYFENTSCGNCSSQIGFVAETLHPLAVTVENNGILSSTDKKNKIKYRYCENHKYDACNWLVPAESNLIFCRACDLNRTIPDLTIPQFVERWKKIETAKHRLIYGLLRMKLPVVSKAKNEQQGIAFDFMADTKDKVFTGHDEGIITINIAEADDIEREMARRSMDEVYRTVLGHFRHEIGHYYWNRLIRDTPYIDKFRALFGDDREDYTTALNRHYSEGSSANWNENYISAYASTHAWEDWAETWAHYMHIIDTLETAYSFGLSVDPRAADHDAEFSAEIKTDPYLNKDFDAIFKLWLPITFALNSLNRSMGLTDIYPFVITNPVKEKLKFIHSVINEAAQKTSLTKEALKATV